MVALGWTAVVIGSLIAGAAFAGILVAPRRYEFPVLVGGGLGITVMVASTATLSAATDNPAATMAAGLIGLGGFVGGYGLVSALLATVRPECETPDIPGCKSDPCGHVLALLLADLEPSAYVPGSVTREVEDLTEAGIAEASIGALPFFYAGHKARYRVVGGTSPEPAQASALAERLSTLLDPERFAGPLLVACSDGGTLARTLHEAADAGYRRVVVATPYIAEPVQVAREKRGVDEARLDPERIDVAYAPGLWDSERIALRVSERIWELATGTPDVGVALVVHGQPGEREHTFPALQEQESMFANRVRMSLIERGIEEHRVRLCRDAWSEPGITETVRHLAALGANRILVAPLNYPFDTIETLLEFPALIRQARTPEEVHTLQVPVLRDDEVLAEEIARGMEKAAKGIVRSDDDLSAAVAPDL